MSTEDIDENLNNLEFDKAESLSSEMNVKEGKCDSNVGSSVPNSENYFDNAQICSELEMSKQSHNEASCFEIKREALSDAMNEHSNIVNAKKPPSSKEVELAASSENISRQNTVIEVHTDGGKNRQNIVGDQKSKEPHMVPTETVILNKFAFSSPCVDITGEEICSSSIIKSCVKNKNDGRLPQNLDTSKKSITTDRYPKVIQDTKLAMNSNNHASSPMEVQEISHIFTKKKNVISSEKGLLKKPIQRTLDTKKKLVEPINPVVNPVTEFENATNTLAEFIKLKTSESDISPSCNTPNVTSTKNSSDAVRASDVLIQKTLVRKANEMDISERTDRTTANHKSAVILKKETDSLKNLMIYDNSSDDTEEEDFEKNWQLHAIASDTSDSESDSDGSLESSSDSDTDEVSSDAIFDQSNKGAIKKDTPKSGSILKTAGEMDMPDLPPIPDLSSLKIDVAKEEFLHMGHIQAIIDVLVTVEAIPGTPAYDLDSYLFIEDKTTKRPLGAIYDVIGPVTAPIYCIRFNNTKEIKELNLKHGLKVFSAPKSSYTQYVFVKELMRIKGSDASWVGDQEIPPEMVELSDEEDEHNLQNVRKAQKRKHGSLERHKEFEKSMNRCNTLNTRVAQLVDAHRRLPRPIRYNDAQQREFSNDYRSFSNRLPPSFDPTVPPPGFQENSRVSNASTVRAPWNWTPQEVFRPPQGQPNATPFRHGQNNSANYYTNNSGRNHAAGPSSQPY